MSSTQEESSRTSEDSLAQSSSLPRDSIITYSDDIGDSSVLGTSIVTYNNNEKLRNAPSSKQSDTSPFYHRKRFWAMCVAVNVVLSAIFIPLLYLVIIPSIAQSTINKSKLQFQSIIITNEKNDSFTINTKGETTEAGPFSAKLEFNGPVTVSFNDKVLGSTEIGDISVSKGSGSVIGTSQKFDIKDNPQFTEFASTTLSAESFKWTIDGIVNVRTFGTKIKNLNLHKEVIIPGSNGYDTSLVDLKINQNPDKTLSLEMTTNLYNPSPIAIEIGDMYLQIIYNGTTIANAVAKNVFINSKENILSMTAISQIPTTDEDRFNYIKVVNGYLTNTPVSTEAKILSIESPNGYVGWLNDAAKNLHLVTKIGQAKAPQLITGIDFGEMNIKFTPDAPFSPTISAKGATADLTMPFNIDFNILSVSQNITLFAQGKPIATIVTPQTNVTTTVTNNGTVISLDIPETQMNVDKDSEDIFSEFFLNLTTGIGADANVAGISNAIVSSVIGNNIPLDGLPFNITTTLQGFNQFNSDGNPPSVNNVTILAGTSSNELVIGAVVTLTNPTRYSTSVGQVTFNLFYREQQIGNIVIQDLTVVPGPNPLTVVITLTDPENNAGKEIMTAFLLNQPISLEIRGFEGSTNIASLVPAFKAIDITTTLPSAPQQLISGTKLLIDNQTSTPNGVVDLANNFVAPISIYTMNSSFSFNEYTIGTYGQDMTNNPIFIPGNSVQRLQLPVTMNYDLAGSFSMLRTLALKNNMDVSVLDSLIVLSKVDVPGVDPNAQPPTPEAIKSFDLGKFVTTALANIPVTINLESRVAVGYYFMSISYQQSIVVETDSSIVSLIPKLAQPMIEQLLGQSQMNINLIYLYDIDVSSFNVYMNGLISNTGPLPAVVNFPNGIDVSSNGVALGKIVNIQPITVDPLAGAKLDGSSRFEIADVPTFTSFMASLFGGSAITGDMSGDAVITSFGAQIGPVPIKQSISVAGFSNNFQDGTKVVGLTLTAGGFEAKVALNNPSMFGVELGKIVFDIFNESEQVSTITGDNVVIVPNNVSIITLDGTLNTQILQSVVAKTPLTIQGESITPPKATGEVVWLTEPFKSIKINAPFDLSQLGAGAAAPAS